MEKIREKQPEKVFEKSALYQDVENFLIESLENKGMSTAILKHLNETAKLVKKFNPKASDAELIAGLGHDAERALVREKMSPEIKEDFLKSFRGEIYLKYHQERGAELVGDFLKERGASEEIIEKVKHLISKHEVGGDEEQNLLMDADSLSFFESNVESFLAKWMNKAPKENIKEKFDWMFDRITSEEIKKLAEPLYKKAMAKLEGI